MGNIYLIGFMGVGKSTIAKIFEKEYRMKLVEMDEEIVRQEKRAISEIFATDGEAYFRNLETELVRKTKCRNDQIVSCGGGTVLRAENVAMMKENGFIICLTAKAETILERVKGNNDRPLLNGNMNVKYISELMEKRRAVYETAADLLIETDGKSALDICSEIMDKLKR
jgi:shikimate kinase